MDDSMKQKIDRGGFALALAGVTLALAGLACSRSDLPQDFSAITQIPGVPTIPFGFDTRDVTPLVIPTLAQLLPPPGQNTSATPDALIQSPVPTLTPFASGPTAPGLLGTPTPFAPRAVAGTPTPNPTRDTLLNRTAIEQYTVERGDTLNVIGSQYGLSAEDIATANSITITDTLFVGQVLNIPLPEKPVYGPSLKILPDSELVLGPGDAGFDLEGFVSKQGGYLATYTEDVPGYALDGLSEFKTLRGSEIVRIISGRYSVSPRLLLAVLEHQSEWVTNPNPRETTLQYPLRRAEQGREGLFRQLTWTANQLNNGYYAWKSGALISFGFDAGVSRIVAPTLNPGTVGVQSYFSRLMPASEWERAVSADGFPATYQRLFGDPFTRAVDPVVPVDLQQPPLILPFEPDKVWAYTGGPHAAFDFGSAWAALDFAPPAEAEGCLTSDEWVVASAPGLVLRSEFGGVALDLDGDGAEGTGWVLVYFHIEQRDRVAVGTYVQTGDRLGHPSCEGGISNGTHVHLSRKYNGEWIAADTGIPFVLDGWQAAGLDDTEYDGTLRKGTITLEACNCRDDSNAISRP